MSNSEYPYRYGLGRIAVSVLALLFASGPLAGCGAVSSWWGPGHAPGLEPAPGPPPIPALGAARQLTFEGARAGEGYFNRDGSGLVFQSERDPDNPFYQIYWMDLRTGDVERLSPGHGKTTCAWVHPSGDRVLFASTHEDPDARKKQADELARRAEGRERRYSWDYDDRYELYSIERPGGALRRLTRARGYDAEASWSPDGETVVFASNRDAFARELSDAERQELERNPAHFVDLYVMDADGGDVRRLTRTPGYDGGPFFSPDGSRIVWRRFSEDGATAEIYTMALDGSDVRQLTRLGAMSWAPFYHPSGRYVIFTTNLHGFGNFELYLVDVEGARAPLRVTQSEGFDGLPVFSPDGHTLAWTSGRTADGKSQIFRADWDHAAALSAIGVSEAALAGVPRLMPADPSIGVGELRHHVQVLTSDEMEGRGTGSPGEERATAYVASVFSALGLEPAGDDGSWLERFDFLAGVSLGGSNTLQVAGAGDGPQPEVDRDWLPLAFSRTGEAPEAPVVFAGYGIVAPESEGSAAYDSFAGLDVEGKWVLVFRFLPDDLSAERRQELVRYSGLRYKSTVVRDRGALGLLVVSGPRSEVRHELVPLVGDVSLSGTSLFAASIRPEIAERMLARHGDLDALQEALDGGDAVPGFEIPGARVSATIDLVSEMQAGHNVIARLPGTGPDSLAPVVVGAHLDHLGRGETGGSLARDGERGQIHRGADDNASGVAVLLEIAGAMQPDPPRRDVLFAAWSGEESGLIGSAHFVRELPAPDFHGSSADGPAERAFAAYLNLDMVGRLRQRLVLFGVGSSPVWKREVERRNVPVGLPIELQDDSYVPSDATSFYLKGVPSLTAFTGAHAEYHTPRDTADRLDYEGMREIARLVRGLADSVASNDEVPEYLATERPEGSGGERTFLRAWLGTIPDYAPGQATGLALSGVMKGGPADQAGVRGGDVIVELAGRRVENIYDYTYAIEALKVGETVHIAVEREGKRLEFDVTPRSRQ